MEVRTGKTITALHAADLYGAQFVLFVTKKKAILSIESDWMKLNPKFMLITINYENLHNLASLYPGITIDLIILDEAHCLGQYPKPSERTKQLKDICRNKPIIYLSGTPTPESYSQLYHQFWVSSFSPFSDYANFYKWATDYVTIKKKYVAAGNSINDYSCADKDKIDRYTAHYFLTYTQQEAGFAQEVQEEVLTVQMKCGTYWLANKLKADRVHIGKSGQEIIADTEVKLMNKLHQIYSGTVIDENKNGIVFDSSKALFIRERFAGQKIAIFYKFQAELEMLRGVFGDKLTDSPEQFNERGGVFVSQIQSGREGINLGTADCLVMLNIDYAAVSYWQARARMQTKDRQKAAKLYWIFAKDGIEHRIYQAVMNKQDYTLTYFKRDFKITTQKKAA